MMLFSNTFWSNIFWSSLLSPSLHSAHVSVHICSFTQTSVPKLLTHNVCMCMCVHRVGPSSAGPGQRGWHANVQPAVFHRLHVTTEHATKKPCGNHRMAGQLSVCKLLSRFSQLYESDQHQSA